MHRDISFNNIMLDAMGGLLLNDWDHADLTTRKPGETHKSFRTVSVTLQCADAGLTRSQGTWPFMSIALLEDSSKPHDILDDLESVFWSKLWGSVKYFSGRVTFDMKVFFDQSEETIDGKKHLVGGDRKRSLLNKPFAPRIVLSCSHFHELITELFDMWSNYYATARGGGEPFKALRKKYEKPMFWVSIFDKHMAKKEEWLPADVVADRFPIKSQKEDEEELRAQLFSHSIRSEAATRLGRISEHQEDEDEDEAENVEIKCTSPPIALPIDALAVANPGPPHSILDDDTNGSIRSGRSSPSLPLNSNGKRTMTSFAEDGDADNAAEEFKAAPSSPLPQAKRTKILLRAPPVAAEGGSPTSGRFRTRSGPIGGRGEAKESASSGRRIASTID